MARPALLLCLLAAVVGCHVLSPTSRDDPSPGVDPGLVGWAESSRPTIAARWAAGPEAPSEGDAVPACRLTPVGRAASPSLGASGSAVVMQRKSGDLRSDDPAPADDPLSLAADCLARGDETAAAEHLGRHVAKYPDQVLFRIQLADLLLRLDRLPDAQRQFDEAIAKAQDGAAAARKQLIHCHTRLMEIARARADEYAERLHRGIGLYLVGVQLAADEPGESERLLCKASGELRGARAKRPDDARAAWYLYRVWVELDQPKPAARALRQATSAAPFSSLTPAEARELAAAGWAESVAR